MNLYPMVLPYPIEARRGNPVHHAAHVVKFMSEILLGERASKAVIRWGVVAALLHDIGDTVTREGRIRKRDIEGTPPGPKREVMSQEAIEGRRAHMKKGVQPAKEKLAGYNKEFGQTFSREDIARITRIIAHHDDPSIQEYEEAITGQWLFKKDDWLLWFHREADRLWMLSEDGVEVDLARDRKKAQEKGKKPVGPPERIRGNIKRHREEAVDCSCVG